MRATADEARPEAMNEWSVAGLRIQAESALGELRGRPILVAAAVGAAIATLALVVAGAAPAETLGAGLGRTVPVLVALIAPAVAALAVIAPWRGLVAWIVTMPLLLLARVEVTDAWLQLTLSTVLVGAIAVGWLLRRRASEGPRRGERLAWLVALAIAVLGILSAVASADPVGALPITLHGLIEPVVLAALVVALRPGRRQLAWLAAAMGASVAVASAYSLLRIGRLAQSLSDIEAIRTQISHLMYYNVGIFGDMLAMAMPLLVAAIACRRWLGWPRWLGALLGAGLMVDLFGLYATFSKSAWLGAMASVSLALLLVARSWRARALLVGGALAVAALVVPYPAAILGALGVQPPTISVLGPRAVTWDTASSEGEVSIRERVLATEAGLRMAADHPLLGVGPGQFGAAYASPQYRPSSATRVLGAAHDFFPNLVAEFGVPLAVLVILAFVIGALNLSRLVRSSDRTTRLLAAGFASGGVGFLVVGATFGVDLYRTYRVMNADVITAALIVAAAFALPTASRSIGDAKGPIDGSAPGTGTARGSSRSLSLEEVPNGIR